MPNWKKVVVSGSDAALNSLTVSNGITGSINTTDSINMFGTAYTGTSKTIVKLPNNYYGSPSSSINFIPNLSGTGNDAIQIATPAGQLRILNTTYTYNYIDILAGGNTVFSTSGPNTGTTFTINTGGSLNASFNWDNTIGFNSMTSAARPYRFLGATNYSFTSSVSIGKDLSNATLDVSGNAIITGSLTVTGTITGSISSASFASTASFLTGTVTSASFATTASYVLQAVSSSFATTASFATSASYATTAQNLLGSVTSASFASTASFLNSTTNAFIQNGNSFGATALLGTNDNQSLAFKTSGSTRVFISNTGNLGIGTLVPSASLHVAGTTILSSSFNTAISGSTLKVQGSGSTQPIFTVVGSQGELFSITDSLSGSLFSVNDISGLPILEVFSDNTILLGNYQAPTLYTTNKIASTITGSNVIYSFPTSSYDGVFIDYTVKSGSNARAGNFAAIWSGTAVNYMDNSTTDFGSTAGMVLSGSISGSNLVVFASGSSAGWTFKGIIKAI